MLDWLRELLFSQSFMPHGHCYFWKPEILWLHAVSDGLIALAYFSIPFSLLTFVRRRRDLAFRSVFLMFGLFILSCGVTHVLAIWTIWHPAYWLDGSVKALTAGISLLTAWTVWRLIPEALTLPRPSDLEAANLALRQSRDELEVRVAARTAELQAANAALQGEIAERHRAELLLAESEQRYRSIVENAGDAIYLHDFSGKLLDVNERACAMTGYSRAELLGLKVQDIDVGLTADELEGVWERAKNQETATVRGAHRRKDGSRFEVEVSLASAEIQGQRAVLAIARDVTERLVLEARLQQAEKMESIALLVGGIAHDFNNMLAAILGFTDLARMAVKEQATPQEIEDDLEEVQNAGLRARDLVAQLLGFSRTQPARPVTLDVEKAVLDVVRLLHSTLPATIDLTTRFEPGLPNIVMDLVQLHQILMNLSVNARDAMQGRGQITLRARREQGSEIANCSSCGKSFRGKYVVLSVSDQGPGMGESTMARIFEPFFTTKEVGKGTGMGLAVVHGIVHANGGHIRVHSQPGAGTEIQVLLPETTEAATADLEAARRTELARLDGHVLVVDDEPTIARFLGSILERCGCTVRICATGHEALEVFRSSGARFDLVVTDQTMPGMTGVELTMALLALQPDLPIIVCTGYSADLDPARAEQLGIRRFLLKPVTTHLLIGAVAELLPPRAS